MPPYKKKTGQEAKVQETGEAIRAAGAPETSAEKKETGGVKPTDEKPAGAVKAQQDKGEIPRFDLAEEIMAEQRKISAIRRKAPGKRIEARKAEKEFGPVGYIIGQPTPAQPYQEQIIAEIVARDIKRMCGGSYSAESE
jgi:hypothetical protein